MIWKGFFLDLWSQLIKLKTINFAVINRNKQQHIFIISISIQLKIIIYLLKYLPTLLSGCQVIKVCGM